MNTFRSLTPPVVFLMLLLFVGRTASATPALDFTGGVQSIGAGALTLGWRFAVTSPMIVGALGLFDVGANGLTNSHQIGLWTSGGTLLTSTTITTANSSPVVSTSSGGDWRFTAISPLVLLHGDYVVGASYLAVDPDRFWSRATASTVPGVIFDNAISFSGGSGLTFPSLELSGFNAGFFGPNLDVVATPEPITMVLGATGLLSLGYAGRRRLFGRWYERPPNASPSPPGRPRR